MKNRNLSLTSGKAEFHEYKINNKTVRPCICEYNLDFGIGCISNINPYFENANEIITKSILNEDKNKVFERLDNQYKKALSELNEELHPEIRFTNHFSQELKEKIWKILEAQCEEYSEKAKTTFRNEKFITRFFDNKFGLCDGYLNGCKYCYAGYNNNNQKITSEKYDFKGLEAQVQKIAEEKAQKGEKLTIRLGKRTEIASIYHLNALLETLKIGKRHKVSFVLPTKHLPFDKKIAELLKETDSVVGYSLAYEKMEAGTVMHGFDNEHRRSLAAKYANTGVNAMLKLSLDCTNSFQECQKNGGDIYATLDFIDNNLNVGLQLIPMRIKLKKDALDITGKTKEELVENNQRLFDSRKENDKKQRYVRAENNSGELHPNFIHDDFKNRFKSDICGDIGCEFFCDSCHLQGLPNSWRIDNNKIIRPKTNKPRRYQGMRESKAGRARDKQQKELLMQKKLFDV
jgi:hypothetical protein